MTIKKDIYLKADQFFSDKKLLTKPEQCKFLYELFSGYINGEVKIAPVEENKLTEDQLKDFADEDNKTQMQEMIVLFNAQEESFNTNRAYTTKFINAIHAENIELKTEMAKMNEKFDQLVMLLTGQK